MEYRVQGLEPVHVGSERDIKGVTTDFFSTRVVQQDIR